jgi:hypothetical protein
MEPEGGSGRDTKGRGRGRNLLLHRKTKEMVIRSFLSSVLACVIVFDDSIYLNKYVIFYSMLCSPDKTSARLSFSWPRAPP